MKRSGGLKRKTPLKAKTGLKVSTKPKVKKRLKLEDKTAQQLIKEADKWFSWYVRLRDSDYVEGEGWYGPCITCDNVLLVHDTEGKWKSNTNAGHFVSRGYHHTRFDETNVSLQCVRCNKWKGGEYTMYKVRLNEKYGAGEAERLEKEAVENKNYRCKKPELLQIIEDCKVRVNYILTTK